MERVMVVGTSCSGKTTLAQEIARTLGAPHIELDALHWGPGWSECPLDAFRAAVERRARSERWVIDGNYAKVRDIVLPRATAAVWLNYGFGIVFGRALRRTVRRIVLREEVFNGNRETLRDGLLRSDAIPWWVVRTHAAMRRRYGELFTREARGGLRVIELRHPRDASRLVAELQRGAAMSGGREEP